MTTLERDKYLERKIEDVDSWVAAVAGAYFMAGDLGHTFRVETKNEISREIEKIIRQVAKYYQRKS